MQSPIIRLARKLMDRLATSFLAITFLHAMGLSPMEAHNILGEITTYVTLPAETATGQRAS